MTTHHAAPRILPATMAARLSALVKTVVPLSSPVAALPHPVSDEARQIAFTFSVIALASHLVCTREDLMQQRYLAFRSAFPIETSEDAKIRKLFDLAAAESLPATYHVQRIVRLFPARPALYESILCRLSDIAAASGNVQQHDIMLLKQLAHAFGIAPHRVRRLLVVHQHPENPYAMLQSRPYWRTRRIKAMRAQLLAACHPDRFLAQGACDAIVHHMNERASQINLAYAMILKRRRLALRFGF